MVTGKASYARLEQILQMERIAADRSLSPDLRALAETEIEAIRDGGAVDPGYQRVKAAERAAALTRPGDDTDLDQVTAAAIKTAQADRRRRIRENRARREAAAATTKRSTRSFTLKWAELDGWTTKYDAEQIAREITPANWAIFRRVLDQTQAFADAVESARAATSTPAAPSAPGELAAPDTREEV